jgi:hypothetical protein
VKLHAAAMLLMGVALHAQVPELDRLLGKDLWKEQAKNLQRLNQMLGEIPPALDSTPQPWHVWKTSHEGRTVRSSSGRDGSRYPRRRFSACQAF